MFFQKLKNRKARPLVSENKSKNQKGVIMDEQNKEEIVEKTEEQPVKEEKVVETEEKKVEETPNEDKVVEENIPLAIKVEDLMTKEEFYQRISSLEAKYDALVKENKDLKEKNDELVNKYEKDDFGSQSVKGIQPKNKSANDTFDEYAKQFM